MDYDNLKIFSIEDYYKMQKAIPGLDGFYHLIGSILDTHLQDNNHLLIVGAGGGRELEYIGNKNIHVTGIDPSSKMLNLAYKKTPHNLSVTLEKTTIEKLDNVKKYNAITSILVMHFFPYEQKVNFLKEVYKRLEPGGVFILADVCFEDKKHYQRLKPIFVEHALRMGLNKDLFLKGVDSICEMPIVSENKIISLFHDAGYKNVDLFYRGLWYSGWWMKKPL